MNLQTQVRSVSSRLSGTIAFWNSTVKESLSFEQEAEAIQTELAKRSSRLREEKDAIEHVRDLLLAGKHAAEDDLKAIDKEIKDIVNASAEFAKDSPEPALDELWTDIYA